MPVAAPADKRFRRSHVHPGKKRRWIPSWRTTAILAVVAIGGLYLVTRVAGFVLKTEALTVNTIDIEGTHRMAPDEALALLDGLRGASIVTVDLDDWREKLLAAPWVDEAVLGRGEADRRLLAGHGRGGARGERDGGEQSGEGGAMRSHEPRLEPAGTRRQSPGG